MADGAIEFLIGNLKEFISETIHPLRKGEEAVKWIEYELETLIPQLESAPDQDERLTNAIHKAEVLSETFSKQVIQSRVANFIRKPIDWISLVVIMRKLHDIQYQISDARYQSRGPEFFSHPEFDSTLGAERDVPYYLRRFVHYFVLFPPEFKVPARRMIALWVAEGLVHSNKHDAKSAEQIAETYLDELTKLGEVQVTTNRIGKVKSCWIDADRRDKLLKEAEEAAAGKIRWLVDSNGSGGQFFIKIDGNKIITQSLRDYCKDVVSFLSFNTQEGSKPGEDIGDFLRKCISAGCFTWLNVLDLELVFRPKLPDTLGKLIALKYLGLRWSYLEQLPESVERLFNLQVLDVKHTYISILPRSIWRMQYLRHLYLSEAYRTRFPDPPSTVALTALQTLWGAFVDEGTCVVNGLDRSLNIRKLGLSCRWGASKTDEMPKKLEDIDKWISSLEFLESLRLKSREESGKAAPLHLTSLEGNKYLSTVYLLGKLDPFILCELPASLTDVTLSGSELEVDPMPFLGRLPNLLILRLLGQSVVCSKMHCSRRGFRPLKVLYIWKLENLEEFEAEEESLPCLEELEIRSCHKLKKLPARFSNHQNLEIKLTSMPEEFVGKEGSKYVKVEHVPEDDQYILSNSPMFGQDVS